MGNICFLISTMCINQEGVIKMELETEKNCENVYFLIIVKYVNNL